MLVIGECEICCFVGVNDKVDGVDVFYFYEIYGFLKELIEELLSEFGEKFVDLEKFDEVVVCYFEKSWIVVVGKFVGGLVDYSEIIMVYYIVMYLFLVGL